MSHTKHICYRTTPRLTASDIAAWVIASFIFGTLLALTFYPEAFVVGFLQLIGG